MAKNGISIPTLAMQVTSEAEAYKMLEDLRWNGEPVCPHCGTIGRAYYLAPKNGASRATRTGKTMSERRVWKCGACRKQFSVLTGTIFHGTKIPLRTWLFVVFEMCASKNGVSAREIERKYNLTAKTAWFMVHRIREAMKREPLAGLLAGTIVADETWIGGKPSNRHGHKAWATNGATEKTPVLSLLSKETGEFRSTVVPNVTGETLRPVIEANAALSEIVLHTDSSKSYRGIGPDAAAHETVNHFKREYVRDGVSTNALEGYFSQLKRSINGTHHRVSVEHLPRYLAEFDYRYTTREMTDGQRMANLVERAGGRRLTYRPLADSE